MGNKISIDKHTSNIEDILEMNHTYFTKIKFENKLIESITQHIKIWRYYEYDKKTRNIKSEPISLQTLYTSNFSFNSNECYLVLFIYKKDSNDSSSSFANFPHLIWGIVESYSNLTPRGLEVPAATSETIHSNILESFLLPKKSNKVVEESKFGYMIFVWNGKTSNALLRSLTLSAAFDFEALLNKGKDPLLQVLFSGGVFRNKKLQRGTILQLNSQVVSTNNNSNKDVNKDHEKQFSSMCQTVYLFKFMFQSVDDSNNQITKNFNKNFLMKNNEQASTGHHDVNNDHGNGNGNKKNINTTNKGEAVDQQALYGSSENMQTYTTTTANDIEDDGDDDYYDDDNDKFEMQKKHNKLALPSLSMLKPNENGPNTNNLSMPNYSNIEHIDKEISVYLTNPDESYINPKIKSSTKPMIPSLKLGVKNMNNSESNNKQNMDAIKINFDLQHKELIQSRTMDIEQQDVDNNLKMNKTYSSNLNDVKKIQNPKKKNNNITNNANNSMPLNLNMNTLQNSQSKTQIKSLALGNLKEQDQARILTYELIAKELENGEINENIRETQRKKIKMDHFAQICNEVLGGFLFVGGEQIAYNFNLLKDIGITNIINCAADLCENKFINHFHYLTYYLKDQRVENIECIFYDSIAYIDQCFQKKGKILVHCVQGVSRSVTICIAYLIYKFKYTYEEAFDKIKKARPVASPNMGFIVQLIMFQKRLLCPYDSLPIPRVFCIGSHQKETPQLIVCRYLLDQLYEKKNTKYLDPRTAFIIQAPDKIYLWIGKNINPANKNLYLKAGNNFIQLLQQNENGSKNVNMIYQDEEPKEFWSLWLKEPETKYQLNHEWDVWFIDISKNTNIQGPTYDRNKESIEDQVGQVKDPNDKPCLYCYPDENNPLHIFDIDELSDECFMVICNIKDGIKTAYIWKGINFEKEMDEDTYINNVLKNRWPNEEITKILKVHEIPHEESDEFLDLFTLRD